MIRVSLWYLRYMSRRLRLRRLFGAQGRRQFANHMRRRSLGNGNRRFGRDSIGFSGLDRRGYLLAVVWRRFFDDCTRGLLNNLNGPFDGGVLLGKVFVANFLRELF